MKRFVFLFAAIAALLLVLFTVFEALHVPLFTDASFVERGGWIAAVGGVALLVLDVFFPVPSSIVMMGMGALFGVGGGSMLSFVGCFGAGVLGFWVGRKGGPLYERLIPAADRVEADKMIKKWGVLAIIVSRPIPIMAETITILAGASSLRWREYLFPLAVGIVPGALLFAWAGRAARNLNGTLWSFVAVVGIAGAVWLVGKCLVRKESNSGLSALEQ